jgi:hypothetical protein
VCAEGLRREKKKKKKERKIESERGGMRTQHNFQMIFLS